nr:hypothetical protein [Vibrio cholerae]
MICRVLCADGLPNARLLIRPGRCRQSLCARHANAALTFQPLERLPFCEKSAQPVFGNRTKHKGVNRCPQNPLLTQADQSAHSVWPWHYCWIDSWRISDRPAWLALGVLHQCTHRFGGARWFENTCRSGIAQGTPRPDGSAFQHHRHGSTRLWNYPWW